LAGDLGQQSLPTASRAAVNGYAASGKLCEQFRGAGRGFAIGGNDDRPFQVFAKLFGANLPLTESLRFWGADLDD
jgi:hypothetical protein